ncbi:MAG: hypothetical protein PGN34_01175 [Methylobacterium frigidaeris]
MGVQVPEKGFIKGVLSNAEAALLTRTGFFFYIEVERADEAGLVISAVRSDSARAEIPVPFPRLLEPVKGEPIGGVMTPKAHGRLWFQAEVDKVVEILAQGIVEDEPEAAGQAEPEQRYAVVLAFGSRPDVVLTPERGVPADEAVRVYAAFVAGAAAIGGRPAMLPLGA